MSGEADEDIEEEKMSVVSPLNATGGFSRELSPTMSQDAGDGTNLDTFDENTALTGSFYVE